MMHTALLLPYLEFQPVIAEPVLAGAGVAVIGRATLGRGARLGDLAVIRADGHHVRVGDDFHMAGRSTIHIAHGVLPTEVGHGVTVGWNCTVHACTVGDGVVVEDHVTILDGARVGEGCVLAAGSVVFPRAELPAGHWCEGSPAKPVRPLAPGQLEAARIRVRGLSRPGRAVAPSALPPRQGATNYVAPTALLEGAVRLAEEASVWFSCELRGGTHGIAAGRGTNIQDNTLIYADEGPATLGDGVTVGHNVLIQSATVGHRVLVGMGSVLAPGTVIEDDVLLAAGAVTLPGQRLSAGGLWAGKPARRLGDLDAAKRDIVAYGARHYVDYNHDYLRGSAA